MTACMSTTACRGRFNGYGSKVCIVSPSLACTEVKHVLDWGDKPLSNSCVKYTPLSARELHVGGVFVFKRERDGGRETVTE